MEWKAVAQSSTTIDASNKQDKYHSFLQITSKIDSNLFNLRGSPKIINKELTAFIKVRSFCLLHSSTLTYKDILSCRDKLLVHLIQLRYTGVRPHLFPLSPVEPEDCTNHSNDNDVV